MTRLVAHELERHPDVRVAVFSAWYDQIMADLFLDIPAPQLRDAIESRRPLQADRYRRFLIDGAMHTTLGDPTGSSEQTWVRSVPCRGPSDAE